MYFGQWNGNYYGAWFGDVVVIVVPDPPPTRGGGSIPIRRERPRKHVPFELKYYIELLEGVQDDPETYDSSEFKKAADELRKLLEEAYTELQRKRIEKILASIAAIITAAKEFSIKEAKRIEIERQNNRTVVMLYMEQRRRKLLKR